MIAEFELDSMLGRKVLFIDDDMVSFQITRPIFDKAGAYVLTALDESDGIEKVLSHQPDLIILNISLPGLDGFLIYQKIRSISNAPIIMLSARGRDNLIVQGLESGANDILSKPINPEILFARARAAIHRRKQMMEYRTGFNFDDGYLRIDIDRQRVEINNETVRLTPTEFRLLVYLLRRTDRVVTFDQILKGVWGDAHGKSRDYVHVFISHIRRKIEPDAKKPRYILSIRGVGYLFEKQ